MTAFAARRVGATAFVLLILTTVMFTLQNVSPVDPVRVLLGERTPAAIVEQERERLGYNDPTPQRYVRYVGDVVNGSLGTSLRTKQPVSDDIREYLPASIEVSLVAAIIGTVMALLFALSGAGQWRWSSGPRGILLLLSAAPPFLLGILSIVVFYKHLHWLPASGRTSLQDTPTGPTGMLTVDGLLSGQIDVFWDALRHLILPGLAVAPLPAIAIGRILRGSLAENLRSDHVRAARARGQTEWQVLRRHCLRNSAGPTLAMGGLLIGLVFGGLTVVEITFGRAGIGSYLAQSVPVSDYPAISGVTLLIGVGYVVLNTIVDLLHAAADPRIRD